MFKAQTLLYLSISCSRVIKEKEEEEEVPDFRGWGFRVHGSLLLHPRRPRERPLSIDHGTYRTVTATCWRGQGRRAKPWPRHHVLALSSHPRRLA